MNWLPNCWQVAAYAGEIGACRPLSKGRLLADGSVACGYHGMRFDACGACAGVPGQAALPARAVVRTFDQDTALLDAQQRVLSSEPSLRAFPVTITIDAGPILGRRLLETKLADEHSARRTKLEPA